MSSTDVSNITQQQPAAAPQRPGSSPQERETGATAVPPSPAPFKDKRQSIVDTVSIMKKDAVPPEKPSEAVKREKAEKAKRSENQDRAIGDVQFAYNFKGDLRVRFMDRDNRVIYQIPPELVARVADTISQPNSSVDIKA